ncbi:MAG: acyl-CoA dehydrogenase N-terminal domain-containing protein, partial [Azospirillaceae bacterium]
MSAYAAPVRDMVFALDELAGLKRLATLPGYEEATEDLVRAVLAEAGRFAGDVFAPTNSAGDRTPAALENGVVRTSPGFRDAYRHYVEAGWNAMPFEPEHGGQGLTWSVTMSVLEMLNSSNMELRLFTILKFGAVEAIA